MVSAADDRPGRLVVLHARGWATSPCRSDWRPGWWCSGSGSPRAAGCSTAAGPRRSRRCRRRSADATLAWQPDAVTEQVAAPGHRLVSYPGRIRRTTRTRKPLLDATRSAAYPCSVSQRCRVSAPRFLRDHQPGHAGGREPGQPVQQQRVQRLLADPDRRVGPDLVVAGLPGRPPRGAAPGPGPPRPSAAALSRHRSSARWLTSTASTVAPGQCRATASAIGPYPQPRSRTRGRPVGIGDSRSSTAVPRSSPSPANTPPAVTSSTPGPRGRPRSSAAARGRRARR